MNPSPKVITGPLHPDNRGACDWGYQGFLAYGCHGYIVVIDMKTLQIVQTVGPQKDNVTHIKWSREKYHHAFATGSTYSLILASADTTGSLYVWDIITGQIRTEFSGIQFGKRVLSMEWYTGHDASHDLLMVLYAPGVIEMWDAYSGINLWRKSLGEASRSFTIDPFDIERIVVLCDNPRLLVLSDITPTKEPSDNITYIQFTDPNPASGGRRKTSSSTDRLLLRTSQSWSKMASIATNILNGPEQTNKRSSLSDDDIELVTSCLQAVFNQAHCHFLILLFPTELQILDIDVELVLGVIRLDRSSPSFVKVIPCHSVDMMLCLHENGSASLRVRRHTEKQQKSEGSIVAMDMTFDMHCQSDALRLLRHSKVFGFVYHPVTEKQAGILLSDSRVILLDVMKTEYDKNCINDKKVLPCFTLSDMVLGKTITNRRGDKPGEVKLTFLTCGLVAGIVSPITLAAMAPSAADNQEAGTLVALGSGNGSIQLVNVYSGQIEKEYKVFMSPVRYLEWLDSWRILTYSFPDPPSYGNKMVKNEVILLNIKSGSATVLRESKDKEGPILLLKPSPSRKYFALVIPDKPLEFWGIDSRQLIREVTLHLNSRPCELIWYPKYMVMLKEVNAQNNDGGEVKKRRVVCEQLFMLAQTDNGNIIKFSVFDGYLSEVKYFDNRIIFVQGVKTDFILMAWKQHYCVVADRAGPLYFADGENGKDTKKFCDNRGTPAMKIQFAPGKDNLHFLVLYTDTLDIYNFVDKKVELEASSPYVEFKIKDAVWTGPESVAIVTESTLHVMTVRRKKPSSPTTEDGFFHVSEAALKSIPSNMLSWKLPEIFSPAFLEPKTGFLLKYSLQCNVEPYNPNIFTILSLLDRGMKNFLHDNKTSTADRCYTVARLFGDEFDIDFWQLFKYKSVHGRPDGVNLTSSVTQPLDLSQWLSSTVLANKEAQNLIDLSADFDLDPKDQSEVGDMDLSWLQTMDSVSVEDFGLDVLMNATDYKAEELSRLALCDKRAYDYKLKQLCSSRWIQVDQIDMAVQGLMETEMDNVNFRSDYLKACLSSCIDTQTSSVSVVKLAATHLIAGGQITDGVELLCLINKRLDACKYLISAGEWKNAVWLAKTTLSHTDCLYVICKWAEHLWHNSHQKGKAVLLMLSMDQYTTVLKMLCDLRQYDLAAMFLQACQWQGLLPSTEYTNCVFAEFAKLIAITEYQSGAKHYCQVAGESGSALLADLQKPSTHNN